MRLDKLAYLGLSFFTSLIIIIVVVMGTYGSNISTDPNFLSFFKWYIFLLVVNLLNILITLIFHYLMADIPGVKGLKGFTGDKGISGDNSKCFCDNQGISASDYSINDDITSDIRTRPVEDENEQQVGTLIYHDALPPSDELLIVQPEIQ
tara:strand:+ start:723 stop:1172 length:450 start_codon:yes stop_codon:yes gene_type:complete